MSFCICHTMLKRKIFFIGSFLFLLVGSVNAQLPNYLWALTNGSSSSDDLYCVAPDNSGGCFAAGSFGGGTITLGQYVLTNPNRYNRAFLSRYDAAGNVLWAKAFNSLNYINYVDKVFVDAIGNCYAIGGFTGDSISIDSIVFYNVANNYDDSFIIKFDPIGNILWTKSISGNRYDVCEGLQVDASGNIYIAGRYSSDNLNLGSLILNNTGGWDTFLAKYDAAGSLIWARNSNGIGHDIAYDLAIDKSGNSYITGYYQDSTVSFGQIQLNNSSPVFPDIYIVKYDTQGNAVWANDVSGFATDYAMGIDVDTSGNCYITGAFESGNLDFGPFSLINTGPYFENFLAKYDANGQPLWAQMSGGSNHDQSFSISVNDAGDAFIAGWFTSPSISFGSNVSLTNSGGSSGSHDIFIAKYNRFGTIIWAKQAGDYLDDHAFQINSDSSGTCFVVGNYSASSITFGNFTLQNFDPLGSDMFIAKIDNTDVGIADFYQNNNLNAFPNPSEGIIYFDSDIKTGKLAVFDLYGNSLYESYYESEQNNSIDLSFLAVGTYLISLESDEEKTVSRLIISR
jgi:Secretion system C-terminal sorting domain